MNEAQALLQIGFLETDQHEAMVDLLHEMSRHYNGEQGASSREVVRANFLSRILGPDSDVHLVTAGRNGRVLGFAAISLLYPEPKERAQLFMKELYVAAAHRGDGIGAALMRWIAAHALRMGCVRFDWTVDADNRRGQSFYEELGARHVPEKLYFRFAGEELERFAAGE